MNKLLLSAAFLAFTTSSLSAGTPNRCQPNSHLPDSKCSKRDRAAQVKDVEMKGVRKDHDKPEPPTPDPGTCDDGHEGHEDHEGHEGHEGGRH